MNSWDLQTMRNSYFYNDVQMYSQGWSFNLNIRWDSSQQQGFFQENNIGYRYAQGWCDNNNSVGWNYHNEFDDRLYSSNRPQENTQRAMGSDQTLSKSQRRRWPIQQRKAHELAKKEDELFQQTQSRTVANPIATEEVQKVKAQKVAMPKVKAQTESKNKTNTKIVLDNDLDGQSTQSQNTDYLRFLKKKYKSEIEVLKLRLKSEATNNPFHSDRDLVVARIYLDQNQSVSNHAIEFIRTELVGWIGVYQDQDGTTPLFHSVTNDKDHITVVCDNDYACRCLEHCIDDIMQMKTKGMFTLIRQPLITSVIYCVDAIYDGIAQEPDLIQHQLQLHRPKLKAMMWMIVSHEVHEEGKTYLTFLIDERSALALNYQYSSNFYICMHKLVFYNRGIVSA